MTSTSSQSLSPGCQGVFCNSPEMDCPAVQRDAALPDPMAAPYAHAAETRRMKAFDGQSKFQAPVADDFYRGLAEPERSSTDDAKSLRHAGMIYGLTAWLRRQKLS